MEMVGGGGARNVCNELQLLHDLTMKPVRPVTVCQRHAPNTHPCETVESQTGRAENTLTSPVTKKSMFEWECLSVFTLDYYDPLLTTALKARSSSVPPHELQSDKRAKPFFSLKDWSRDIRPSQPTSCFWIWSPRRHFSPHVVYFVPIYDMACVIMTPK